MRNRGLLWLVVGAALLASLTGWAQDTSRRGGPPAGGPPPGMSGGPGGSMRGGGMMMRQNPLFMDLSTVMTLTAAEAKTTKAIQDKVKNDLKARFDTLREKQEAVNTAVKADKPDMAKVKKLIGAVSQEQTAIQIIMVEGYLKLKAAVPAAQRAKLPELTVYPGRSGMRGGPGGAPNGAGTPQRKGPGKAPATTEKR